MTFPLNRGMTFSRFRVPLPDGAAGLILKRVCSRQDGPMAAQVLADGEPVEERLWIWPDHNGDYRLLEDCFLLPARCLQNKRKVEIELRPLTDTWNECRIRAFALYGRPIKKEKR